VSSTFVETQVDFLRADPGEEKTSMTTIDRISFFL
jgi:hypothetical protein